MGQQTGSQAARCLNCGGRTEILEIDHPGEGAAFADSPRGGHSPAQTGIAKLTLVKIIQLYFLQTTASRKLVYLHI